MWAIVFIGVISCGIVVFGIQGHSIICEGLFHVDNVEKCENADKYPFDFTIIKRKINRTHDGFSLISDLLEPITADFMVRLEAYEKCDGGYKKSDVIGPTCACSLMKEHAKEMFERALTMAKVEPADCPIPKGPMEIHDMVVDYYTMPRCAKQGEMYTEVYLIKNGMDVGCIRIYTTFEKADD